MFTHSWFPHRRVARFIVSGYLNRERIVLLLVFIA